MKNLTFKAAALNDGRPTVNRRSTDGQSQRRYSLTPITKRCRALMMVVFLFTLGIGQMWAADPTHESPSIVEKANRTFLNLAGTPSNVTVSTDSYSNYGPGYFISNKNADLSASWWSFTGTFKSSSSSYSNVSGAVGFHDVGSSSSSEFYQILQMRTGSDRMTQMDFYVTGTTQMGFQWKNAGKSGKYLTFSIYEMDVTGATATDGASPVSTVQGTTTSSSDQYAASATLDGSKYYHVVVTPLNTSNINFYGLTFKHAPATSHTVTYLPGAGSGPEYIIDDDATTVSDCPAQFSYTGHDFAGWKDALNNDVAVGAAVTSDMTLTAQWVEHVAKYTVKYMDGTTVLGTEEVNVGSTPAGLANDPTKDCYTFAAWSPALNTVSGDENDVVEVSATWTPNYFTESVDFEEGGSTAVSGVASKNIVASNAGSYDGGKASENWAYKGWKIKSNGATVKVLVQANKKLTFKFGYLAATAHVAISGDATNYSVTGASKVEDDPLKFTTYSWTKNYDALYTFTTGSGDAAVIKALTVQDTYTATRVDGKSDGAGSDANVLETTLPTPTAISGWTFTGWTANEDVKAGEDTKTAGTVLAAGAYTLLANTTFTAQWAEASSTYDITYVSAHGTAPAADNAASVVLAELAAEGWAHKGWTANADVTVDAATVEAGTLIANGKTAVLASNVTFTAVWKEIFTVTFNSKGGSSVAPVDVEDGATLAAAPADPTKDDYIFLGWSETDGGDVVADITAITISDDKTFYAKWKLDVQVSEIVFSNSFKGWINGSIVTAFYLEGESAPTVASYDGKNLKAEGGVVISGDKIIATATDDSELEFDLTMTEVTPLTTTGAKQTFDGSETYVKSAYGWKWHETDASKQKGWAFQKLANDGRIARGLTREYFFFGPAESATFTWKVAKKNSGDPAVAYVYVDGVLTNTVTSTTDAVVVPLKNTKSIVAFESAQTNGDCGLKDVTLAPWVPVTAVTLKEGEDAISSKEIWESTSFTLTAEVTPDNASNKTITWTSSNEAVATVENGVVTGVAASADPVTITASTVDGVNATCVVTVTTAPQPSADPVITAQPQSADYYEGASVAALEVEATGAGTLTYQWYLGSEAIEGAIAATYQPTVSAIGSYVYHCVVTNTEAGNLPTSLASDNATITIADDPAAIKLLDGEGNVNTTNFTTGVTAGTVNFDDADHKCASFGSTGSSIVGLTGLNKVVAYNATTTQTKVKFVLYNTNSSAKELYLQKVLEDATVAVTETISVPSKELYETQYYTYNSSDLRSFYVTVNSTNIKVLQVKVIDNGTALKRAGEAGYELNLNQGRVFGAQNVATNFEGLAFAPSSNAKVLNSTELPITTPLSFTIAAPLTLKVTTSAAKYYVSQNASEDGTTATAVTSAGEEEFDLTVAGTWYIVPSTTSAVKLTNLAFALPKAAKPVVADMDNVEYCQGSAIDALTVSATVSDGGTMLYQWYKDGVAIEGADEATYQPTVDAEYYVVVVNTKAGHQNSDPTQSNTITVTGHAGTAISGTIGAENWPGTDVTISVTASGKNLQYAWYTCDDAMGANPVAVDPAVNAAELDVTVGAADTYYKVVVSGDCGDAQEAIITVVARQAVDLQDVTGDMNWDFSKANDGSAASSNLCNDEVLANVHGIVNNSDFKSDNIKATANKFSSGKLQASMIMFHTTVGGIVTVVFSHTGNNKTDGRALVVNGTYQSKLSHNQTAMTYKCYVPAGDVVLTSTTGDGGAMLNFTSVDFKAKAEADYTRNVSNNIGTLCVDHNVLVGGAMGATFYQIASRNELYNDKIDFEEVLPNEELKAGEPYIFHSNTGKIELFYGENEADAPVAVRGMIGSFVNTTLDITEENKSSIMYIAQNKLWNCEDLVVSDLEVVANRAYIDMSQVPTYAEYQEALQQQQNPAPRRRVTLGRNAEQVATGIGEVQGDKVQSTKVLIDGHIYILRGEKMFDATGRLVK